MRNIEWCPIALVLLVLGLLFAPMPWGVSFWSIIAGIFAPNDW